MIFYATFVQTTVMKYLPALVFCFLSFFSTAQKFQLPRAKFITGDSSIYKSPSFDDKAWKELKTGATWDSQGYDTYDGYAWYRFHFVMGSVLKKGTPILFSLGKIDDACEVYFNGTAIGKSGAFPSDKSGYISTWDKAFEFRLEPSNALIKWDEENVLCVKVYDGGGAGGIFSAIPTVNVMELIDGIIIAADPAAKKPTVTFTNTFGYNINGKYSIECINEDDASTITKTEADIALGRNQSEVVDIPEVKNNDHVSYLYSFTENSTKKSVSKHDYLPYILTPLPGDAPKINGAKVYGVRPNSPFIYKIPATGKKPLQYSAENLPQGFTINPDNGVITGKLSRSGDYTVTFVVKNALGTVKKDFTIKCGDLLALTPPMGWNS